MNTPFGGGGSGMGNSGVMAGGAEDENVGQTLKYDLGTPIFLNTLANKLHTKLVDTASVLAYHQDPRDLKTPSQYEELWTDLKMKPPQPTM